MGPRTPEKIFRIGNVRAEVYLGAEDGSGKDDNMREVSVLRTFTTPCTPSGCEQIRGTFTLADLPATIRVLELAMRYIEGKEASP